jgi:hypothetical protein
MAEHPTKYTLDALEGHCAEHPHPATVFRMLVLHEKADPESFDQETRETLIRLRDLITEILDAKRR